MTIPFQKIDDLPIGVTAASVMEAFRPFVATQEDRTERIHEIRRLRRNAVKRAWRRVFGSNTSAKTRSKDVITGEYEGAWSRGFDSYDLSAGCRRPEPFIFRGQDLSADLAGVPRFRNVILAGVIRALKPRRVLEVGCGNGINLLLLANQFPDVSFAGVELTEAGNRVARELQRHEALPPALAAYYPGPQADPQAFRRIDFQRGDATAMAFDSGSFDLVFTVLSVEQMERVRDKALTEIARVSGRHVLNMEPFADANRDMWRRLHVFARDYFKGRIDDLPRYGLEPQWATMDFPQEVQLGAALVLSRKRG